MSADWRLGLCKAIFNHFYFNPSEAYNPLPTKNKYTSAPLPSHFL